jgi:acid phosphatase (class A)
MKFRLKHFPTLSLGLLGAALSTMLLQGMLSASLLGEGLYLPAGRPDGIALLCPPPLAGSEEQAADLASARLVFRSRTPELEARALKSASLSMFIFEPAIGPILQKGELSKTETLFANVKKALDQAIDVPKYHWRRLRPYQIDESLNLGKPEPSPSYPSGHSTRGTVYSLLLAEIFPEKRDAILEIGREIGWDRVLIGKHFPTDVFAGRVLGQAVFRELMASTEFQHDLREAKAEVAALQNPGTKAGSSR